MGTLITTSRVAAAEQATVALRYSLADGTSSCPSEATLRGRVTEEVGYDPFVSGAARSLTIEISRDKLFSARVVDRAANGTDSVRVLTSSVSCDDLLQSVVLTVAVSLDPEVQPKVPAETPPAKKPDVTVLPVLVPIYVDRPAAPAPKPPSRGDRLEGYVAAGFGAGGGFVPDTSIGPVLALGLRRKYWDLSLEGTAQLPSSTESSLGDVEVFSVMGGLVPCFTPSFASWGRALVCGNLSVGGAFASASDVEQSTPAIKVAAFTGPRAGVAFNVAPHFETRLAGELLANLTPLEAQIRHVGLAIPIYEAPPLAGRVITSLAVSFP